MLDTAVAKDFSSQLEESWSTAQAIVEHSLVIPSPFVTLIRNCWCGIADADEFVRLSGFTNVSPICLIQAAGLDSRSGLIDSKDVVQAIHVLGIRSAAVVLAINCSVRSVLKAQPGSWWREMLENLALDLSIGYRLGARVGELGVEGGMLTAFGQYIGQAVLSSWDKAAYRTYRREQAKNLVTIERELELFGCEPYQIAATVLQALGFGAEVAFGTALAVGKLDCTKSSLDGAVRRWPAAAEWLIALKLGRNYPASLEHRNFFLAISPGRENKQRNSMLDVLYTEVAKARQVSTELTWHLPKSSYEATKEHFKLA